MVQHQIRSLEDYDTLVGRLKGFNRKHVERLLPYGCVIEEKGIRVRLISPKLEDLKRRVDETITMNNIIGILDGGENAIERLREEIKPIKAEFGEEWYVPKEYFITPKLGRLAMIRKLLLGSKIGRKPKDLNSELYYQ